MKRKIQIVGTVEGHAPPPAERITVGYVRVSSRQTDRQVLSPDVQKKCIQDYCKLHGLGRPEIVSERESAATIRKRPELLRVLEMCRAGQVAYVVVQDLTRLFRDMREALNVFNELEEGYGVKFLSAVDMMGNQPGADGKFVRGLNLLLGQREREVIGERTSRVLQATRQVPEKWRDVSPAMAVKAATGTLLCGKAPFGYRWGPGRKGKRKLIECSHDRPIVLKVHELRAAGLTYVAIAEELWRERIRDRKGAWVTARRVERILTRGWV